MKRKIYVESSVISYLTAMVNWGQSRINLNQIGL